MPSSFSFERLANRWIVRGNIVMDTALHIGSGQESEGVDAGVVLDRDGRPYIPGSSLKGVLRSEAERLAPLLGLRSCGLFSSNGVSCLTTDEGAARRLREQIGQRGLTSQLLEQVESGVCDTCRLFGSSFAASRVMIDDLPMLGDESVIIERRDGVGIDRDTGTAAEHIKYDFHVVPAATQFALRIQAENLDAASRRILSFVLLELRRGSYGIGGKRSRGLARCHVADLSLESLDMSSDAALVKYLTGGTPVMAESDAVGFLAACVREE